MLRFSFVILILCPLALRAEDKPAPFASKEGKFSAALPGKPAERAVKVKYDGSDIEVKLFTVDQKDKGRAFVVTYSDYPKDKIGKDGEKFVADRLEGNVSGLKGKTVANDKLTLGKGKHPGREIRVELPAKGQLYRARAFLVGERLYQVVVLGPEEFVKGKEADDFFTSFAVDE